MRAKKPITIDTLEKASAIHELSPTTSKVMKKLGIDIIQLKPFDITQIRKESNSNDPEVHELYIKHYTAKRNDLLNRIREEYKFELENSRKSDNKENDDTEIQRKLAIEKLYERERKMVGAVERRQQMEQERQKRAFELGQQNKAEQEENRLKEMEKARAKAEAKAREDAELEQKRLKNEKMVAQRRAREESIRKNIEEKENEHKAKIKQSEREKRLKAEQEHKRREQDARAKELKRQAELQKHQNQLQAELERKKQLMAEKEADIKRKTEEEMMNLGKTLKERQEKTLRKMKETENKMKEAEMKRQAEKELKDRLFQEKLIANQKLKDIEERKRREIAQEKAIKIDSLLKQRETSLEAQKRVMQHKLSEAERHQKELNIERYKELQRRREEAGKKERERSVKQKLVEAGLIDKIQSLDRRNRQKEENLRITRQNQQRKAEIEQALKKLDFEDKITKVQRVAKQQEYQRELIMEKLRKEDERVQKIKEEKTMILAATENIRKNVKINNEVKSVKFAQSTTKLKSVMSLKAKPRTVKSRADTLKPKTQVEGTGLVDVSDMADVRNKRINEFKLRQNEMMLRLLEKEQENELKREEEMERAPNEIEKTRRQQLYALEKTKAKEKVNQFIIKQEKEFEEFIQKLQ